MNDDLKEVRFDIYCDLCIYKDKPEKEDPCNECLNYGMMEETERPYYFKQA